MEPRRHFTHRTLARLSLGALLALLVPLAAAAADEQRHDAANGNPAAIRVQEPAAAATSDYGIRLRQVDGERAQQVVEVEGLSQHHLSSLAAVAWSPSNWNALLSVYVAAGKEPETKRPAVLGSYGIEDKVLRFTPRFSLEPGLRYQAVLDPSRLPGASGNGKRAPIVRELKFPAAPDRPAAVVEAVYPSTNHLPENQLKFYIHFSAPMSRGEAYRRIHLVDASGQEDDAAFLELGEELWDPAGTRFTLFIDPGRIKRGLKPREDLGPVLEQGNSYTLRVDRAWRDAAGKPLARSYEKKFDVRPPDERPLDVTLWRIAAPPASTRRPLTVGFAEPLDHAMLHRVLVVIGPAGEEVAGEIAVESGETRWQFTPDAHWQAGRYKLVVDTALEDLAGNSIGRSFEVDVFRSIDPGVEAETVSIPFQVRTRE